MKLFGAPVSVRTVGGRTRAYSSVCEHTHTLPGQEANPALLREPRGGLEEAKGRVRKACVSG